MSNYARKLASPKWQRKRLEVFQRDDFTCQICDDTETELHVHHKKYTGEPHEAPMEDLITMCCECHEMETFYNTAKDELIKVIRSNKYIVVKSKKGLSLGYTENDGSFKMVMFVNDFEHFHNLVIKIMGKEVDNG